MATIQRRFSAPERSEIQQRWRQGHSLREMGRSFGRSYTVVGRVIAANGGFPPAVRRRHPRVLSLSEREELSLRGPVLLS